MSGTFGNERDVGVVCVIEVDGHLLLELEGGDQIANDANHIVRFFLFVKMSDLKLPLNCIF